ncbi:MAG: pantetheine-phosphate adenylyltransferase [Alphaproteobacteria bacterium]|nr:MAG: pantetheine-phosphate adenylyltransferase [Alphaproteobacteria bacterium]
MSRNGKFITGIYPGTFDPVTKGHLHLIRRASRMVDRLIVAVADSPKKEPLFTDEQRLEMLRADIENLPEKGCEIEIHSFNKLLVHFARDMDASFIFRGLRAVSDFEYEFQMTGMNAKLDPDIETVFLMAADKWQFVSSSFVKEIAALDGVVDEFVTPQVARELQKKFEK